MQTADWNDTVKRFGSSRRWLVTRVTGHGRVGDASFVLVTPTARSLLARQRSASELSCAIILSG